MRFKIDVNFLSGCGKINSSTINVPWRWYANWLAGPKHGRAEARAVAACRPLPEACGKNDTAHWYNSIRALAERWKVGPRGTRTQVQPDTCGSPRDLPHPGSIDLKPRSPSTGSGFVSSASGDDLEHSFYGPFPCGGLAGLFQLQELGVQALQELGALVEPSASPGD